MHDALEAARARPSYQIKVLRPNHTVAAIWRLEADDDDDALARMKTIVGDNAVELWDGPRFIEQFQVQAAH